MKTSLLIPALLACTLSASVASAQDKPAPGKPATGMETPTPPPTPQMPESMEKMQRQMERIRATRDPKEHQMLMREHLQTMQGAMKSMPGMGGPMMMGGDQRAGRMPPDRQGGMTEGEMMKRQAMMEKRMEMMQLMIDQLLQRSQAADSMSPMSPMSPR